MDEQSKQQSYSRFLRSSSIIGLASILNILFGIVRMKAVALLFGPSGVGVFGLLQTIMQTGTTIASVGTGTIGTQQVSAAARQGDAQTVAAVRAALLRGSTLLALLGGLLFWTFGKSLTFAFFATEVTESDLMWLTFGIICSVVGGAQLALLTGSGRIGDVARVQVLSGFVGTAIGLCAIWFLGRQGLGMLVVMAALFSVLAGTWFVQRGKPPEKHVLTLRPVIDHWARMMQQALPYMLSSLVNLVGFLIARAHIQNELGLVALGMFQSAWTLSALYLVFVLGSMTTDYFARLSSVAGNSKAQSDLINQQTEVALLLCGPIILFVMATAPWIMQLLYSAEFVPAAEVVRWQLLGDVLRLMNLPLSYLLLATGRARTYLLAETIGMSGYLLALVVLVPQLGYVASGPAYVLLYVAYLPVVYLLARRHIGFRWSRTVVMLGLTLLICLGALLATHRIWPAAVTIASLGLAILFTAFAFNHLVSKSDMQPSKILTLFQKIGKTLKSKQ